MGLFNFKKKKVEEKSCVCGCGCGSKTVETKTVIEGDVTIIVYGSCCKKSTETFENVKLAAKELGLDTEVLNIGDTLEIAKAGIMSTPALVVNNKLLSAGKQISLEDARTLLQKAL